MSLFTTFLICYWVFLAYMYFRIQEVAKFRDGLLKQVSDACMSDIEAGRSWFWRYEKFNSVTFDQMVWHFWRDVRSFYKDYKFIEP